jgi:hypothetical protein
VAIPLREEEAMSIQNVTANRPSGMSRGFTLIELKKPAQSGPESPAQNANAAKE